MPHPLLGGGFLRGQKGHGVVRAGVGGGGAGFLDEVVDDQRGPLRVERVEAEGGDAWVVVVVCGENESTRFLVLI